jgi:RNA-directed DNA polymerase
VKDKYFHRRGTLNWVFSGEHDGRMRHLFSAASVPIRRHVKVTGAANPYDPAWETYFEHRRGVRMEATLKGRRTLLYLWKRQDGLCPRCHQPISSITGWHNHHVIWKSRGGSDGAANRVLLHPTCHRQLHSRDSTTAPRPTTGRS